MTQSFQQSPFNELREALSRADQQRNELVEAFQPSVRVDAHRARRAGTAEVVFAGNKASTDVADALRQLVEINGRALASRVRPEDMSAIQNALEPELLVDAHPLARALVASRPGIERASQGGIVGILSAGTSDIPI